LAINLKNTKAITFAVPQAILARAKLYRLSAFRPTLPIFPAVGMTALGAKPEASDLEHALPLSADSRPSGCDD
jgi:hypothetical protein